jgi:hypothetical protein
MLTRVDTAFDGPVILFQDVIEVLHRSMLAVPLQNTLVFELHNRRRVSGVLVGVDDSRRRMVCSAERFGKKALCCGRVLLGREEKVEGRAGRIHRSIQVAPLALDPDVGFVHPPTVRKRICSHIMLRSCYVGFAKPRDWWRLLCNFSYSVVEPSTYR